MTLKGHYTNGVIVLDEPAHLPEGAVCVISVDSQSEDVSIPQRQASNVAARYPTLLSLVGKAEGLPSDAAENIDHYLYGHP